MAKERMDKLTIQQFHVTEDEFYVWRPPYQTKKHLNQPPDLEEGTKRKKTKLANANNDQELPVPCEESAINTKPFHDGLESPHAARKNQKSDFSGIWNNSSLPSITLQQFKERERRSVESHRQFLTTMLINRAAGDLKALGMSDIQSQKWARNIVVEGKRPKFKTRHHRAETGFNEVYARYASFRWVKNYQCLFLSAPSEIHHSGSNDSLTYEEDATETRQEMDNFALQVFPVETPEQSRIQETVAKPETQAVQQAKDLIKEFFKDGVEGITAKTAFHAWIVFFCHGSPQGIKFQNGEYWSLDEINHFVKDIWLESLGNSFEQLPGKVLIIYSQCYGHLYDPQVSEERFCVVAMATEAYPYVLVDPPPNQFNSCYNEGLAEYAEQQRPVIAGFESKRAPLLGATEESHSDQPSQSVDKVMEEEEGACGGSLL